MDPSQLEHVERLIGSLQRSEAAKYLVVISAALFIWDHIVTFQREVELVWPSRWGAGKIIFLLVRYMTWPDVLSSVAQKILPLDPALCHPLFEYIVWSSIIRISAAEMILVLRTWAIWNGHRGLLAFLSTLLLAGVCVCCYVVTIYISRTHFIAADTLSPQLQGCFITGSTTLIASIWIALTSFDFVIVALTMIKAVQHFRNGSSGFIASLYRDGLLYFVYLFVISLGNILVLYLAPVEYAILLSELPRVLYAMLACRIILHLRAAQKTTDNGTSTEPSTHVASRSFPRFRSRREGGVSAWFGNVSSATWDIETAS